MYCVFKQRLLHVLNVVVAVKQLMIVLHQMFVQSGVGKLLHLWVVEFSVACYKICGMLNGYFNERLKPKPSQVFQLF